MNTQANVSTGRLRIHCFGGSLDGFGGGGVATIQQYLREGLVDALKLGCRRAEHVTTPNATHVVLRKHSQAPMTAEQI